MSTQARIELMPDSFVRYEIPPGRIAALRRELGLQEGRRVLLLLGVLDQRKGPQQLLSAISALSPEVQRQVSLVLIGRVADSICEDVTARVKHLQEAGDAQVVLHNAYVSDEVVQHYYELADVALTTYQQHMGMSSALIRAALAGVPVLSSNYGLMGELVRRHQLGVTADTTSRAEFCLELERVITADPHSLFDAQQAAAFAEQHSPEALARTLSRGLCGADVGDSAVSV